MTLKLPSNLQFLPQPFEWIYIPSGSVELSHPPPDHIRKVVHVKDFFIAKYPITNAQYKIYVDETGRKPEISHRWDNDKFNYPLHPVCELRWQEAMLFSRWVSSKIDVEVTLPSLAQWQRAGQGDDNRNYPWGDNWDETKSNAGGYLQYTTPVTQYHEGSSPFGVMDLVGNVFEWCITSNITGTDEIGFEITGTRLMTEELLMSDERVFKGSAYNTHIRSAELHQFGACPIFFQYMTGIRLVVDKL